MMFVRKSNLAFVAIALIFLLSLLHFHGASSYITNNKYRKLRHIDQSYTKVVFDKGSSGKSLFSSITDRGLSGSNDNSKSILILTSISDNAAYAGQRQFTDYLATLESLYLQTSYKISLGLFLRSQEEFDAIENYFSHEVDSSRSERITRVTLLIAPFVEIAIGEGEARHADSVQRERRRAIARARNLLLSSALQDETYTLFVDSDIEEFKKPESLLDHFVNSDLDIVVPRIVKGLDRDYDKNSWKGTRTKPSEAQMELLDSNSWDQWDYVPKDVPGKMYHFENYVKNKPLYKQHRQDLNYTVELDSVGGAVLFAKSIIYKQGIIFPTNYVIGTTWERKEGYDGMETEGLCYLAKPLGYKCWGMPNIIALHGDR